MSASILHVPTVSWSPREGISRAVAALVAATPWHRHHLLAARPNLVANEHFATVDVRPGWMGAVTFRRTMRELLDTRQPDIVHLHGGALIPLLAASPVLRDVPVIATIYGPLVPLRSRDGALRSSRHARGACVPQFQSIVSSLVGPAAGRWALRAGHIETVCTPDPLVADALRGSGRVVMARGAASVRTTGARWSEHPVIGFAGRAERGRGIEDLVDAFALVHARLPNARLRLLVLPGRGDGNWLRTIAAQPGVDVRIGEAADFDRELASCQVVVLPFRRSMTITPPLVAAEAMAAGVPVVGTAVPCITPLVRDGVGGRLVAPADVRALADAIYSVVADRAEWEQTSDAARAVIEREWSWTLAAAATDRVYATLTEEAMRHVA